MSVVTLSLPAAGLKHTPHIVIYTTAVFSNASSHHIAYHIIPYRLNGEYLSEIDLVSVSLTPSGRQRALIGRSFKFGTKTHTSRPIGTLETRSHAEDDVTFYTPFKRLAS